MIFVGLDFDARVERPRENLQRIFSFNYFLPELDQFASHPGDTICFLFPGMRDPGDLGGAVKQWSNRRQCEEGIGDGVEVGLSALAVGACPQGLSIDFQVTELLE